jgi:hypothetical protein
MGGCFSNGLEEIDPSVKSDLDGKIGKITKWGSVGADAIDLGEDSYSCISRYARNNLHRELLAMYVLRLINAEDPQVQYVLDRAESDSSDIFSISFKPSNVTHAKQGILLFSKHASNTARDPPHRIYVQRMSSDLGSMFRECRLSMN